MKNTKPMLGAMSIVGKDKLGRKLILPTDSKNVVNKSLKKKTSKIKSFINVVVTKIKSIRVSPLEYKMVRVRFKKRDFELCCEEYSLAVHSRILKAQEEWRRNKRIEMGFEKA